MSITGQQLKGARHDPPLPEDPQRWAAEHNARLPVDVEEQVRRAAIEATLRAASHKAARLSLFPATTVHLPTP